MISSPAKVTTRTFSLFSGAFRSDNLRLRDEPSAPATLNVRVTLAGTRNVESSVRGVDSFMGDDYFRDRPGYIYLLESPYGYKIGRTNDPTRRLNQIKMILPFEAKLIHLIRVRDTVEAEACIHDLFRERRLRGEWFDLSAEDVAFFKMMGNCDAFQRLYGLIEDVPVEDDGPDATSEAVN